ncbi:RHS repeat-associated core domain-containing protein, partial [Bacillus sp. REN10]|uniref:RHS repeat domain-containing protein n=1 Tax=Bacillus sp. REN10 TaxID=2782541 RepID=UPI00193AF3B5
TKDNKYTYVYNKFDQITSIKTNAGTTIASFTYDDEGRKTSKKVYEKTTYYHYDQGINVLFETDENGTITAEYVYDPDGMPVMMTKGEQNYYYTYNGLKEITGLTNVSGTVVASYFYDAWGNILSESGSMAGETPIRYKGYRYDIETDLYYLIARYYQPTEGVFPEGGDTDDPKTQNGYAYANNNPVMMTDPDGNYAWAVINAGFAVYSGYKAYKKGEWKAAAVAGRAALIGGAAYKGGKVAYKAYKAGKFSKTYRLAKKVSKKHNGTFGRAKGNGWTVTISDGKKHNYMVRLMNKGSGGRSKPYYKISHTRYDAFDRHGNRTNDPAKVHMNLSRKSYREINRTLKKKH